MTNVLITGGAGFIGTHLTRLALAAGHEVTILDSLSPQIHGEVVSFSPPVGAKFIHGDVCVRSDLTTALDGVDTVVHLAAETGTGQSMYEVERYYRVNLQGTALLFDILANRNRRIANFILASSRSVYGEGAYLCHSCDADGQRCFPAARTQQQLAAHDWSPRCPTCDGAVQPTATREDDRLSPASIYAATKLAQEDLTRVACTAMGVAHSVLRFQNVFGEGQSLRNPYTGILSIFSTRIRLGLQLPIFEDGAETRDFIHVDDVANAVLRCIEQPKRGGATFNVGLGKPVSIESVASLLCRIMHSTTEPRVTGEYRVGDIRHNFADISQIERLMGFRPKIGLEAGLRRFSEWVAEQPVGQDLLDKANEELRARDLMG